MNQWSRWYLDDATKRRLAGQISPDKDMNFQCTTAAFTLSPAPGGLRHLVLTRPGTKPAMRFLSVGSHLCARASSRQPLARLPLPSASSYLRPLRGHLRYSYRGLSPHQFTPMPGVHECVNLTAYWLAVAARPASQYAPGYACVRFQLYLLGVFHDWPNIKEIYIWKAERLESSGIKGFKSNMLPRLYALCQRKPTNRHGQFGI